MFLLSLILSKSLESVCIALLKDKLAVQKVHNEMWFGVGKDRGCTGLPQLNGCSGTCWWQALKRAPRALLQDMGAAEGKLEEAGAQMFGVPEKQES